MRICELPRLKSLLDMMGLDNGSNVVGTATVPDTWKMRARLAEDELLHLSADQAVTLAMGEETEMDDVAKRAPNASAILHAAFDAGELAEIFFEPWRNIFDARDAEKRFAGWPTKDQQ